MDQNEKIQVSKTEDQEIKTNLQPEFKKPVLIGRVGRLPRRGPEPETPSPVRPAASPGVAEPMPPAPEPTPPPALKEKSALPPAVLLKELSTPIPYKEPKWSGLPPPGANYRLEVVKSGVIVDEVGLDDKPYHVFGRFANSDIVMAHPTISRHHAVLQYRPSTDDESQPVGLYVWDCGSTHGTFLNRKRLPERTYVRVRVGHMLKLGCSTRTCVLLGPEWDAEGESELTVTEMKQKHAELKAKRETEIREAAERRDKEKQDEEKRREDSGIDWGMGDDAEDEPDLADNPYASTNNEQLFLTDPKKTLRGYYEREGLQLEYDCREKAPGQFICRVELPLENSSGGNLIAEVVHRGKKKEAVVACALEACRILDRHGLLRQEKHESRRRKERDWSADDFYDSDEDPFLERTGAVERKRLRRMQQHAARQQPLTLTHADLVKKCSELSGRIGAETGRLDAMRAEGGGSHAAAEAEDELEHYMSTLDAHRMSAARKADISKLKSEIAELKLELSRTERLCEAARPAELPALQPHPQPAPAPGLQMKMGSNSVIYGKRIKLKNDPKVKVKKETRIKQDEEFVEEVDSDEEIKEKDSAKQTKTTETIDVKREDNPKEMRGTEKDIDITVKNEKEEASGEVEKVNIETEETRKETNKRVFGPMRPPDDYVMPTEYLLAETDRDDQQVMEDD